MVSPFFLVALYTAANMVKREQEDIHDDGDLKRTETSKYPSSFYRLPRYLLRDQFTSTTVFGQIPV
jgi:hypothetical protein